LIFWNHHYEVKTHSFIDFRMMKRYYIFSIHFRSINERGSFFRLLGNQAANGS
jgi:hypothetical protein